MFLGLIHVVIMIKFGLRFFIVILRVLGGFFVLVFVRFRFSFEFLFVCYCTLLFVCVANCLSVIGYLD